MIIWVLLFALGLRLIALNQSLWLDEAILAQAVTQFSLSDLLTRFMPTDFNPPLIYIIESFWVKFFGASVISLRFPSVIFGLITIWLTYKISKNNLWPALLLATSGLHIYYSQEARMYSLACMAVTASFYFLFKKKWFYSTVFSLMAIYTHYLTIFILPVQLFLIKRKELKKLFLSWAMITLGFLPWLPTFLTQLQSGLTVTPTSSWGQVIGGSNLKQLLLIPIKFLIGRISIQPLWLYISLLIPPLALTGYLIFKARKSKLIFYWLTIPLLLIALVSIKVPLLAYFRLLFLLPAFYLLIAQTTSKKILVGFLALNLISSGIYLFNPSFHREDWQTLASTLSQKNQNNTPVVIIEAVKSPLDYYSDYQTIDSQSLDQLKDVHQFWLIPYAEAIFDPQLTTRQQIQALGYSENYKQHFRGDLTLIEYTK